MDPLLTVSATHRLGCCDCEQSKLLQSNSKWVQAILQTRVSPMTKAEIFRLNTKQTKLTTKSSLSTQQLKNVYS